MKFYTLIGVGKAISKECCSRTQQILKQNGIDVECIEDVEESGMWLEIDEEKELQDGEIVKENKKYYMRLDDKVMRFYKIEEILIKKRIDLGKVEENIIVIYKNEEIDYLSYGG